MLSKFTKQIVGSRTTFGSSFVEFSERSKFSCFARFIRASLFSVYTNLQLLLHLANLTHKFLGLVQRLGQVSSNSEDVQNLAVLHGFIRATLFALCTNLQLLLRSTNLPHKFLGLVQRLGQVCSNSENVQNLAVLHSLIRASLFSFYTNLQ